MDKQAILEATVREVKEGGRDLTGASITYRLFQNADTTFQLKVHEVWDGQICEDCIYRLAMTREEAFDWIFRFCTDEVSALHVRNVLEDAV